MRTLVRQADNALYAAKEPGKGRWTEYMPEHGMSYTAYDRVQNRDTTPASRRVG